jgi:hypothetical protein
MAMLPLAGAGAATVTINTSADEFNTGASCALREAVEAANTNATVSGCPGDSGGGTGLDTILLQGGQTYTLSLRNAVDDDTNAFGDLDITGGGGTIIRRTGAGLATIDAGNTIAPFGPPDNQRERVLDILSGAGGVTLEGVKVTGGADMSGAGTGIAGGDGGGIRSRAPLTLTDSEVTGNEIGSYFGGFNNFGGGGILIRNPGSLTMSGSTVAGNRSKANTSNGNDSALGGGISMDSNTNLTATNSTIAGNTIDSSGNTANKSYGGGVMWYGGIGGGKMNLTNVTIANNSAIGGVAPDLEGAGIEIIESNGTTSNVTLTNTILAGNHAPDNEDCGQLAADDDWTSGGNNVIGDSTDCDHNGGTNDVFFSNPNLGTLSNYGGDTRTMLPNPGSPSINRGGTCPATDQRSLFRYISPPCDTGAVEVGATSTPPPTAATGPTGQRAAALAKCKKKKSKKARKKCKRKANLLPV